jgi:hypothetical protein
MRRPTAVRARLVLAAGLSVLGAQGLVTAKGRSHGQLRGAINRKRGSGVAIDVSGEPYLDLEREAAAMLAGE